MIHLGWSSLPKKLAMFPLHTVRDIGVTGCFSSSSRFFLVGKDGILRICLRADRAIVLEKDPEEGFLLWEEDAEEEVSRGSNAFT